MDAPDHSIIFLLHEDGRMQYTEIAKASDVSQTSFILQACKVAHLAMTMSTVGLAVIAPC